MKKIICVLFAAALMLCAGCGENVPVQAPTASPKPVISSEAPSVTKAPDAAQKADVDLTKLSSTMVYSEVYQMMTKPSDYMGKTVKMKGTFAIYQDGSKNYFACLIADATACCQQGIEFVLKGEHKYPDDYPKLGSEITVTGVFGTYYEGENMFCQLSDAVMN